MPEPRAALTMQWGVLYWHPLLYEAALQVLYRGRARERFLQVAARVPDGAMVVDLCAGTSWMYRILRHKSVRYQAVDLNPRLVAHLRRAGIDASCADLRAGGFAPADVVTMCSSLYQFHPDCRTVLEAMVARARDRVIVLEPVRNTSSSRFAPLRWLGQQGGVVAGRRMEFHFTYDRFRALAESMPQLRELRLTSRGRDALAVFAGDAT